MDELVVIAHIRTAFSQKFGIPRQSGTHGLVGRVEFCKPYADPAAVRGLQGYSHVWLLWGFSEVERSERFSPTVRPPRLGGNTRMGVFATRSPYRPNPIAMSVVKLLSVQADQEGVSLLVDGVDMLDGTPVYDVKPYLPYADRIDDATGGWSGEVATERLPVVWDVERPSDAAVIEELIAQDPRPHYIEDGSRVFGMEYERRNVRFCVVDGVAHVLSVDPVVL